MLMNGLLQGTTYCLPLQEQEIILLVGDLLSVSRPVSKDAPSTLVSVEALATLLEEKKGSIRRGMLLQVPVLSRGFVDTSAGLNLTSEAAMDM